MFNWSQACSNQVNRPQSQLAQANYASNSFAVGSFALAAVYSAFWWRRWAAHGAKSQMWVKLGWFSAWICVDSVAGVVAWAAQMPNNALYYENLESDTRAREYYSHKAASFRWFGVYFLFYGLEFLCLMVPKLMLLQRLVNNAARGAPAHDAKVLQRRWCSERALPLLFKATAAIVLICSSASLIAYAASAAVQFQAAYLTDAAAAACDALGYATNATNALITRANEVALTASSCETAQSTSEAAALLFISAAYILIVTSSISSLRLAERAGAQALLTAGAPHGMHSRSGMH